MQKGGANHVERFNGTHRAMVSRLIRHAYSLAQSLTALIGSIGYMIYGYNPPLRHPP
jgi:hypothetical protein